MNQHVPFTLSIETQTPGSLNVVEFRAVERLGRPTSIRIRVASTELAPEEAETLLGAEAKLVVEGSAGGTRRFSGLVRRVAHVGDALRDRHLYSLEIVSRDHLLGYRRTTRIFQDKSVPEIVVEVLSEAGVSVEASLQRTYAARTYCVQYQEDDRSFVSRLLADEGIFHFVRDPAGSGEIETLVLADTVDALEKISEDLPFRPRSGFAAMGEFAESVETRAALRPGVELVRAFDFRRPHVELAGEGRSPDARREDAFGGYEHRYDLKQESFDGASARNALAQRRSLRAVIEIESNSLRAAPGLRLRLSGHPTLGDWLTCVAVEHRGWTPGTERDRRSPGADGAGGAEPAFGYSNRATCAAAGVEVGPKRKKRRLRQVLETATVVGPPGEEIHTDAYGRIKVQFHWDLQGRYDERSSCWIRAMQPWAGGAFGFQFIPRVGMEVVVAFSAGDTDLPLVLGCLYNGANPLPNVVPSDARRSGLRTRSSPGGDGRHELMFDDTSGEESIDLRAERDLNVEATRDHDRRIARDERLAVGRNVEHTVGGDHVRSVAGNEIVTIEKNLVMHVMGTQSIRVDGGKGKRGPRSEADVRRHDLPSSVAGATTPASSLDGGRLSGAAPPTISAAEGELVWRIAQLPAELDVLGHQLNHSVTMRARELARLDDELAILSARSDRLLKRAGAPASRRANQPAALATLRDLGRLGPRIDSAGRAVAASSSGWPIHDDPRFTATRAAAARRLAELKGQVAEMRSTTDAKEEALSMSFGVPSRAGPRIEPQGIHGAASGGGGGGSLPDRVTTDDTDITYAGKPDADGVRSDETAPIGTHIDIDGAGEIDASDGFKIVAGGCSIEMFEGVITVEADTIILSAGEIQVSAKGTVAVTGTPINLN